jgi:hypothetical protein
MSRFSPKALLVLRAYDMAGTEEKEENAVSQMRTLSEEFSKIRAELEIIYAKTRILTKPGDYILDQDHHVHLANQSTSFDWQFYAEMLFIEKLEQELELILGDL